MKKRFFIYTTLNYTKDGDKFGKNIYALEIDDDEVVIRDCLPPDISDLAILNADNESEAISIAIVRFNQENMIPNRKNNN